MMLPINPLVSVIMNCYNGEAYLKEAIDSVFSQTYSNWEIIFWDNNSSDRSAEIAKSYGEKVKYYRSDVTYCISKARNLALSKVTGEFIAILDCDDLWRADKLEKQVPLFSDPEVGLVFSDTVFFNGKKDLRQIYKHWKPPRGMIFKSLFKRYYLSLETIIVRTSCIEALGLSFDEKIDLAQDKDFLLKIAYQYKADYIDEPLAKWRIHSDSWTQKRYDLFAIDNQLILNKWFNEVPGFEQAFEKEVVFYKQQIVWQTALAQCYTGNRKKFREILALNYKNDIRMAIMYPFSFLPNFILMMLIRFYQNYSS